MTVAIYTDILTPYRKHFFDALYKECLQRGDHFYVLVMSDTVNYRKWNYEDYKAEYTILLNKITVRLFDTSIHYNPQLLKVISQLNIDILICGGNYYCPGIWKAAKNKKRFGYKCFFWSESHLDEIKNYNIVKLKIRELIRRKIYKQFDGFWYAGKLSLSFIKKYERKNTYHIFVPNLVDESIYNASSEKNSEELKKQYRINSDKKVLFCSARLNPVKGIDKFLNILFQCKNKNEVIVVIAGEGEEKMHLEILANKLNLNVLFVGYRNQKEMIDLYTLADTFVLPSISDPNPLSCIEALWCGLPLFLSKHVGNYPEVVLQGKNGFVFDYKDEGKAKKYLEELIDKDEEWLGNAKKISHKLAKKNYSTQLVVPRIMNEMHEIVIGF